MGNLSREKAYAMPRYLDKKIKESPKIDMNVLCHRQMEQWAFVDSTIKAEQQTDVVFMHHVGSLVKHTTVDGWERLK